MKQPLTPDESLTMLTRALERLDLFVAAPTLNERTGHISACLPHGRYVSFRAVYLSMVAEKTLEAYLLNLMAEGTGIPPF